MSLNNNKSKTLSASSLSKKNCKNEQVFFFSFVDQTYKKKKYFVKNFLEN